uniref:sn-1-specific diacylglycerol lipase n=1 Tax=Rhodosorus marinus TaxID=101924 RepID=A0A7S3EBN9_9RHOD|mmetsp:Transcript_20936/g.85340  ORF Transcript_20936/g.85340 Transcript_20936/m.85340 type:complete len:669 (+) Transcript_20936:131-2137(+)
MAEDGTHVAEVGSDTPEAVTGHGDASMLMVQETEVEVEHIELKATVGPVAGNQDGSADRSDEVVAVDGTDPFAVDTRAKVVSFIVPDSDTLPGGEHEHIGFKEHRPPFSFSRISWSYSLMQARLDRELEASAAADSEEDTIELFQKALAAREQHRKELDLTHAKIRSDVKIICACWRKDFGCRKPDPSDQRKQALDEFTLLLNELGAERLNMIDLVRGYRVMRKYPRVTRSPYDDEEEAPQTLNFDIEEDENEEILSSHGSLELDEEITQLHLSDLEKTHRLSLHAWAAYGKNFEGEGKDFYEYTDDELAADREFTCGILKLHTRDLVKLSTSKGPFKPQFYVAVDHSIESIVVAVKGTTSFDDLMTDLSANSLPVVVRPPPWSTDFQSKRAIVGGTHIGLFLSAKHVVSECRELLISLSAEFEDYDIFVTGHSLGGGAASVATILLYNDDEFLAKANPVYCVAIGPPPSVSEPIAEAYNDIITTFVNQDDLIPTLGVISVATYLELCKEVRKLPLRTRLAVDFGLSRVVSKRLEGIRLDDLARLTKYRLFLAGTVFHLKAKDSLKEMAELLVPTKAKVGLKKGHSADHVDKYHLHSRFAMQYRMKRKKERKKRKKEGKERKKEKKTEKQPQSNPVGNLGSAYFSSLRNVWNEASEESEVEEPLAIPS